MAIKLENLKYLKEGIENLTPMQLCNGRLAGYVGMVLGCVLATISLIITKQWWWVVFTLFLSWIQLLTLFAEMKAKKQLVEYEQQVADVIKNSMGEIK